MTDYEITKICAEVMGWKHLGSVGVVLPPDVKYPSEADARFKGELWCLSGSNDWWTDPEGHTVCGPCQGLPDPLNDDAQAMALVKKFQLTIGYSDGWSAGKGEIGKEGGYCRSFHYPDLNRAICVCVAAMQPHK